mgnify:FL=1
MGLRGVNLICAPALARRTWNESKRRWQAYYKDANGKRRHIGYFDDQESAAHAVNSAIRRAGLVGKRRTNPVVDGRLVPRERKAKGHGWRSHKTHRREESAAATPSPRARRPRRAVNDDDSEPDADAD